MKRVELQPHQERWALEFAVWKKSIQAVLADQATSIDHFGSTAIPGIHAKPIIDILVARRPEADFNAWVPKLASLGLTHARLDSVGQGEGQWFFRDPKRTVHVHVYDEGSSGHRRHLAFRDALLADATLRRQYDSLKVAIAQRALRDMDEYIDAKAFFVRDVEARALGPSRPL